MYDTMASSPSKSIINRGGHENYNTQEQSYTFEVKNTKQEGSFIDCNFHLNFLLLKMLGFLNTFSIYSN